MLNTENSPLCKFHVSLPKNDKPKIIYCIVFFSPFVLVHALSRIGDTLIIYKLVIFCRIIEPLASRCAKFRFKPLSEEIMSSRILYICKEEGLYLDAEVGTLELIRW